MKINEFASKITKLEGGKQNLTVAQVSEVLKLVNGQLWGIPYWLIKAKKSAGKVAAVAIVALMVSGCATFRPNPAPMPVAGEVCTTNKVTAVIDIKPVDVSKQNFALGKKSRRFPSAVDTIFGV